MWKTNTAYKQNTGLLVAEFKRDLIRLCITRNLHAELNKAGGIFGGAGDEFGHEGTRHVILCASIALLQVVVDMQTCNTPESVGA